MSPKKLKNNKPPSLGVFLCHLISLSLQPMNKKQLIFQYLDSKYGNCETYENEATITINGVCTYYKILKSVGLVGAAHKNLCDWFGNGSYNSIFADWFYEKYKLEI